MLSNPTIIGHTDSGIPVADPREFGESEEHRKWRLAFYEKVHGNCAIGYFAGLRVVDDSGAVLYHVPCRSYDGEPLLPKDKAMLDAY